ncbi:MAG: hypothetical protein R2800_04335 [Flavipsychrobacter sp.]
MTYKQRLWISAIAITLICWVDHQLFSEGMAARIIPAMIRQTGHLIILSLTLVVGYWGWKKHPHSWTKRLWLLIYTAFIVVLILVGIITWQWQWFNKSFLDIISTLRYAFCSPLPLLMIYVLTKLNKE